MGVLFFCDDVVAINRNDNDARCHIEVADNHGTPEVRIGPEGNAHNGIIAEFQDWEQFQEFVDAINSLHQRLEPVR